MVCLVAGSCTGSGENAFDDRTTTTAARGGSGPDGTGRRVAQPALVADGPPMVAVSPDGDGRGFVAVAARTAWLSGDGEGWSRVASDDPFAGLDAAAVAVTPDGAVVAAGSFEGSAAVVALVRGRAGAAPTRLADGMAVDALFATPDGVLAVGRAGDGTSRSWWSSTGRRWTPLAGAGPTAGTRQPVRAVAARAADGRLLALVGADPAAPLPARRVHLEASSRDGQFWSRLEPTGLDGDIVNGLAAVNGRLVAVGGDGTDARMWVSADGGRWQAAPVDEDEAGGDGEQVIDSVVSDGRTAIALGRSNGQAASWTITCPSACALRSNRGSLDGTPRAAAIASGRATVVGGTDAAAAWQLPDDPRPTEPEPDWARVELGPGRATAVTASGGGWVAAGQRGDDAVAWLSDDADRWEEVVVAAGPGVQTINAVVATAAGIVAAGVDDSSGAADVAVWTSADGRTWARAPDALFAGPGNQAVYGATTVEDGTVVVAGTDDALGTLDGAVWVLPPGGTWVRATTDPLSLGGLGNQTVRAVTAGTGPDRFLAVGAEVPAGGTDADIRAVRWTSTDGIDWTRLKASPSTRDTGALLAAAGPARIGGYTRWSPDHADASLYDPGGGFRSDRLDNSDGPGDQSINAITLGLAAGVDNRDAAVWTADGGRVPHRESVWGGDGEQFILGLAEGGDGGAVAVGGSDDGGATALAWVHRP